MATAAPVATLSHHIGVVIGLSAEKQMLRVDTRRIVTLVTDAKPWRNLRHKQLIGDAMG